MFIYCGDCGNKKVRVLDTDDMVTEEIDILQLKSLQSKGYTIKKDFSYDYAHNILKDLDNCGFDFGVVSLGTALTSKGQILSKIYTEYNERYGVGISLCKLSGFKYHYFYRGTNSYILSFIKNCRLFVIFIHNKGIFFNDVFCNSSDRITIDTDIFNDCQFFSVCLGDSKSSFRFRDAIEFDEFVNVVE